MPQGSNHRSVYIVEDDLELSTVLDRVLKSIDHRIALDWSTTAEEAIQTMNRAWKMGVKRPYDLIVIDVFLDGDQNGLDLWNLCRREYPDIPVVLTSAHRLSTLFSKDTDPLDIPIFLQKPFGINECKSLFKRLLSPPDVSQASA